MSPYKAFSNLSGSPSLWFGYYLSLERKHKHQSHVLLIFDSSGPSTELGTW